MTELIPGDIAFVVVESKREGYDRNIIVKCMLGKIGIYRDGAYYHFCPLKTVVGKEYESQLPLTNYIAESSNIDTGYRRKPNRYPVFTTKEKCIEWLKG